MPIGELTNQKAIDEPHRHEAIGIETRKIATGDSDAISSHR